MHSSVQELPSHSSVSVKPSCELGKELFGVPLTDISIFVQEDIDAFIWFSFCLWTDIHSYRLVVRKSRLVFLLFLQKTRLIS